MMLFRDWERNRYSSLLHPGIEHRHGHAASHLAHTRNRHTPNTQPVFVERKRSFRFHFYRSSLCRSISFVSVLYQFSISSLAVRSTRFPHLSVVSISFRFRTSPGTFRWPSSALSSGGGHERLPSALERVSIPSLRSPRSSQYQPCGSSPAHGPRHTCSGPHSRPHHGPLAGPPFLPVEPLWTPFGWILKIENEF